MPENNKIKQDNAALALCHLIRMVVNPSFQIDKELLKKVNWESVKDLATRQGVLAFVLDAFPKIEDNLLLSKQTRLQWIGEVLSQEYLYSEHAEVISELSSFYESHKLKMLLLKGWGLSLNYPVPNHRPTGDVDIWLYGNQEKGDEFLLAEKGIQPIKSSHHTIFSYNNIEVENHITFIEVDCHKADGSEEILLDYAKEPAIEVKGAKGNTVLLPSPNLNAYFLLRHASAHFSTEVITIRHLLDWGFFVEKYHDVIDWNSLYKNAREKNMHIFLDCQNSICVNRLGFDKKHFPIRKRYPNIEARIFNDILSPEFNEEIPVMREHFIKYCYLKTKRLFVNKWKYEITYKEKYLSILLRFAWNRIKSPYTYGDLVEKNNKNH